MKRGRDDDDEQAADPTSAAPSDGFEPPSAAGAIGSAQYWFYTDTDGQLQGPQPTSSMRAWYEAGYFEGVSVAASYYGEVPDAYWPIAELWKDPATQAFVLTDGTAAAQVTQEAAPFIPSSEFAGGKLGYVFKTEEWGVGYYEDVSHVDEHGTERWGPKPEVTAASIARHKAEALAKVRNVGYDEDVRA